MSVSKLLKLTGDLGITFTVVANLSLGSIEMFGDRELLPYRGLVDRLFGDIESIWALNQSLEGQLMPRTWAQGHMECVVCKPADDIIVGLFYEENRDMKESYRFTKDINTKVNELWKETNDRIGSVEFDNFQDRVHKAMTANPIWFGLDADPIGTDADIQAAEIRLSITLPDEYKRFVKSFGVGYFAFANVFSVIRDSEWDIVAQNQSIGLIDSHHFIAISDNQAGDYCGFKVVDGVCESRISVYDHESRQVGATNYDNLLEYLIDVGLNNFE